MSATWRLLEFSVSAVCDQGCDSCFAGGVDISQNFIEESVEGIEEK